MPLLSLLSCGSLTEVEGDFWFPSRAAGRRKVREQAQLLARPSEPASAGVLSLSLVPRSSTRTSAPPSNSDIAQ